MVKHDIPDVEDCVVLIRATKLRVAPSEQFLIIPMSTRATSTDALLAHVGAFISGPFS